MTFREITVKTLFSNRLIEAGTSDTSISIDLGDHAQNGSFSVVVILTGAGTLTLEYQLSSDNRTFIEPLSSIEIVTGFTAASGRDTNGKDIIPFSLETTRFLKLSASETGGVAHILLTCELIMQ